jgi:hypothetical protein
LFGYTKIEKATGDLLYLFLFACMLSMYSFLQRRVFQYGPDGNPHLEIDLV